MHRAHIILAAALSLAACTAEERRTANAPVEPAAAKLDPASQGLVANAASPALDTQAERPRAHPCHVQNGKPVPSNLIRAVGNEPFWSARIDGRCVTYSTPEDIKGTRIWTKFSGTTDAGAWTGALDSQRFELRTTPQAGCSDTMSDNIYPIAVTLFVRGEERRGCAEPLPAGQRP